MNISKFTKSMLWVVILSAVSQSYSMSRFVRRNPFKSVVTAFGTGAGATHVANTNPEVVDAAKEAASMAVDKLSAKESPAISAVTTSLTKEQPTVVEQPKIEAVKEVDATLVKAEVAPVTQEQVSTTKTEVVDKAKEVAQDAATDVAQNKVVDPKDVGATSPEELTRFQSFKKFVADKATDKEFLKQGFYGVVTISSTAYLVHKSGVLVKVKKHWQGVLVGAILPVGAGIALAAVYPEAAVATVRAMGKAVTTPYAALITGATAAGTLVGSKVGSKLNHPKIGAGIGAGLGLATASAAEGLNYFGCMEWAKKAAAWTGKTAYDAAAWTVKKASDHPYIATGAGVAATGALTYPLWKGYMPWNKSAQSQQRNQVPGSFVINHNNVNINNAPAGNNNQQQVQPAAPVRPVPLYHRHGNQPAAAHVNNQPAVGNVISNVQLVVPGAQQGYFGHDPKKEIPALLIAALKGDQAALATAKGNAGNDNVLIKLIDKFMSCSVAKLLRNHYHRPRNYQIYPVQFEALCNENKALLKDLAVACGVQSIALMPAQ